MPDLETRLTQRLVTPRPDCQIWTGATDRGYGRISVGTSVQRVHRVAWELKHGPIPDDLTIDHLCRVKVCCNTDHMELVTAEENTRRAGPFALKVRMQEHPRQRRTHCRNGHELNDENTYSPPTDPGYRYCLVCRREKRQAEKATG